MSAHDPAPARVRDPQESARRVTAVAAVLALGAAAGAFVWLSPGSSATGSSEAETIAPVSYAETKDITLGAVPADGETRALYSTVSRAERAALLDGSGVTFTVLVDSQLFEVTTAAETFGDALAQAGVVVGWDDEVAIDLSAPPVDGAEVRIGRVDFETVTETVVTPFETQERQTDSLDVGKTRVVQAGADGYADVTSLVRYVDGAEVARSTLLVATLSEPVTEVIEVGTRVPAPEPVAAAPAPTSSGGSSGGGSAPSSAQYTLSQFLRAGVVNWDGKKFTYYSQQVLPGSGLKIPGRHVNSGGYVADGSGYIVLAAPRGVAHGTVYSTPFGYAGKVYDTCASCSTSPLWLDVYVR